MQTFASMRERRDPHIASKTIFDLIAAEMALVEDEFERQAASNIQVINYLGEYLRASGGKRVRPGLIVQFVPEGGVPRTPTGKVRRRPVRAQFESGSLAATGAPAPRLAS